MFHLSFCLNKVCHYVYEISSFNTVCYKANFKNNIYKAWVKCVRRKHSLTAQLFTKKESKHGKKIRKKGNAVVWLFMGTRDNRTDVLGPSSCQPKIHVKPKVNSSSEKKLHRI